MIGSAPEAPDPGRPRLVLAGGGHSHALLLRLWVERPALRPCGAGLTLVSRSSGSLYSGLVPGLVAGRHDRQACTIDLRRLCGQARVRFLEAEIEGLDPLGRRLLLRDRPPLPYGRLSLDVGSITDRSALPPGGEAMAVKPLEPFLAWCEHLEPGRVLRLRGGGAAAVELALALRGRGHDCVLLLRGDSLHLGSARANRAGEGLLRRAGIAVMRRVPPEDPCDLLCTGSRAPAWLAAAGLPVHPDTGRVLCDPDLRVRGHPGLFVSGDCGLIAAHPRPPAGVWAVRAAPLLAANLVRSLEDPQAPLRRWRPPRRALQLLADGSTAAAPGPDGTWAFEALALWGPFAFGPSLRLGRWKQRIDRRFMERLAGDPEVVPQAGPTR